MKNSFKGCKKLKQITLPQSLKTPEGCFDDLSNIQIVNAPARFKDYFVKLNANIKFNAID